MGEVAFKVKPDSDLYRKYFIALEEKRKFNSLAEGFFKKYGLSGSYYYQTENLCLELTPEERETFAVQIKKVYAGDGMYSFKKNSVMQKDWTNSVCSHIDFKKLHCADNWYLLLVRGRGRHALWAKDEELYGLLAGEDIDSDKLPDYMERISLSKYYAIRDGE